MYGARPLRRLVQTAIGDPLARLLISGEVADGDQVEIDHADRGRGADPDGGLSAGCPAWAAMMQ